jgi:hypothetical protein
MTSAECSVEVVGSCIRSGARPRPGSLRRSLSSALSHAALALRGDDHDLVVLGVETNVVTRYIVVDDEIHLLVGELPAGTLEPVVGGLRCEADEDLAVLATLTEAWSTSAVGSSSIVHVSSDFGRFASSVCAGR